ncbi:MAG: leucine-rich repeat domain-containing protein [Tenuifilaceae bacterium]
MKTPIVFFLMFSLLSCGQPKKDTNENKENIANETISKSIIEKTEIIDTLSLNSIDSALLYPEKVVHLTETNNYRDAKHLPSQIGLLVNLKTLELACLEELEDLPVEIGQLKKLEKLIINNGNGCIMNVSIPSSIGQLQNLRELVLYGALDASAYVQFKPQSPLTKVKKLPEEISELKNLEVLDLGRNRIDYFPTQIEYLTKLRILRLEYSDIKEIPPYISKLVNLEEINVRANGRVILPNSLGEFKALKMIMGDCELTLKDQAELRKRFPNIVFDFENEYVQGSNEQETP